ncbi:MAG: ABC transporter ATP-binding protein [Firmicutes bacterium]|nr:ABC transporter ATP-binding protein [Bacillota bacterium]
MDALKLSQATQLLSIENLHVRFNTLEGVHEAVRDVSITLNAGETLGIVGESGSGKSVTSLSIMRLIADPPGKISAGRIIFGERDLLQLTDEEIRSVRGNEIAMIFQEPMTSLNPIHTCGKQVMEPLLLHKNYSKKAAQERALELMHMVGIPLPAQRMKEYPHQLSGGMRQRVMIAMALACQPKLLIADEPTTALDVTIQAQILQLMKNLREEINSAIIMITHDLGVIAEMCKRVIVMYAGQVMEISPLNELFAKPYHPYSEGLLLSIPTISKAKKRLFSIEGTAPNFFNMPPGCSFAPRCTYKEKQCHMFSPELTPLENGRAVRCFCAAKLMND